MYVYTTHTRPLSVQAQYISSSCYNSSLVSWMVVCLTTAKFKPLIFTVSGFALSNVAKLCIFVTLYDFCLLPAYFCYIIIWQLNWIPIPTFSYILLGQTTHRKNNFFCCCVIPLLGLLHDRYLASPLAHWLLPSNVLGTDLQKTRHVYATHCCVMSPRTQRKHCSSIVGHVCVAGVAYQWIYTSQYHCPPSTHFISSSVNKPIAFLTFFGLSTPLIATFSS
jgi:hypothetical protein